MNTNQARTLIQKAYELLEEAHHLYYKNATNPDDCRTDDAICDALDNLEMFTRDGR